MPKVHVLRSNLNSIFANLAIEEALIAKASPLPTLFMWRNEPTVTIGRHQNPWKECNLKVMDGEGVSLARRYSGGGAVYQDMGCTTFTFVHELTPSVSVSSMIDANFDLLVGSLKALGLPASRKGRNDIVVGEYKVSGSAFKQMPDRLVHHGTILVDTDMSRLGRYLTPSKLKLKAKGISSVSARVSNLSNLSPSVDHDVVCESLAKNFRTHYACSLADAPVVVDDLIQPDPVFQQHHTTLLNWDWRYGTTPEFSNLAETRIDGIGTFDVHYEVVGGKISTVKIFSDVLVPDVIDVIQQALLGCEYKPDSVRETLLPVAQTQADPLRRRVVEEFSNWFSTEIR